MMKIQSLSNTQKHHAMHSPVGRTSVRHCSTKVEPTHDAPCTRIRVHDLHTSFTQKHRPMDSPVGRTLVRHCSTKGSASQLLRFEPTTFKQRLQSGFTLLEMVLVLFLIGLMASATLMLTEGVEDQAKYDETKRRMDIMRKAIVGDPTRTINGGPEISGFVADMGRLPNCVRELLEAKDCASPAITLTAWTPDASTGIGEGWRGPYIQVLPERAGLLAFRDGYGNYFDASTADSQDFGWTYDISTAIGKLSLTSDAFDITDSADDVVSDSLIVADDWQANNIYVNFINQNASDALPVVDENLNLRVYLSGLTNNVNGDDGGTASLTAFAGEILSGDEKHYSFSFDASNAVPLGTRGYAVVCYDVPTGGTADTYVLFDGDCNDASNAAPTPADIKQFTVIPRQDITLDWTIQ